MNNPLYENILIETRTKQREDYSVLENQEESLKRKETKLQENKNKLHDTNTDLEKELDKLKRDLHYYK